jgi:hypothetical protein
VRHAKIFRSNAQAPVEYRCWHRRLHLQQSANHAVCCTSCTRPVALPINSGNSLVKHERDAAVRFASPEIDIHEGRGQLFAEYLQMMVGGCI